MSSTEAHIKLVNTLMASDRVWEATIDSLPDAVYIFGADKRLKKINRAGESLEQARRAFLSGRRCCDMLWGLAGVSCMVDRAMTNGAAVEVASGLRKVNQGFVPIFAPIVAGLTIDGDQQHAAIAFSRVSQWMLWILLPLVAGLALAGSVILGIYGAEFRQGGLWLAIIALACATNAFVSLAETVIMVQKPRLNLLNSIITCIVALLANLWLISRLGVTGAALGILLPYVVQGILRYRALRMVFRWQNPWGDVGRPLLAAAIAAVPAIACRVMIAGLTGQVIAALVFFLVYGGGWLLHRRREAQA